MVLLKKQDRIIQQTGAGSIYRVKQDGADVLVKYVVFQGSFLCRQLKRDHPEKKENQQ
jgi:hypothetical protein